ncbi:MAG: PQQ-binding-like beta-propeller repeat protein [Verrucomicrobiota bacterium]
MVNVGELVALEARSGRELWRSAALKSAHSSPVIWKDMVLWQGAKEFVGLSLGDGSVRWRHKGGGDASPVISGDTCVLVSKSEDHSLSGFRLSPEGARRIWEYGFLSRRYGSSPLIHEGHLYHLGSARQLCLDLSSGEVKWEVDRVSNLSSPILVGDRILSFENNGGYVSVIRATPEGHEIEGRTRIGALGSSSASMDESLYVVRQKDRVVCFDWSQRAGQDG